MVIKRKRKPGNTKHLKPKNHPWVSHSPGLFKSTNEPYKEYIREGHTKRLIKSVHKGSQGQGVKSV